MKRMILFLSTLSLASCAHYNDVRAGADGIHHVVVNAPTAEYAENKAISEAALFCEDEYDDAKVSFVKEERTKYHGELDKETKSILRNAGLAAIVAGAVLTGGHFNMLSAAGTGAFIYANGNDYTADMYFRCDSRGTGT